jgi:hypothetical protein
MYSGTPVFFSDPFPHKTYILILDHSTEVSVKTTACITKNRNTRLVLDLFVDYQMNMKYNANLQNGNPFLPSCTTEY